MLPIQIPKSKNAHAFNSAKLKNTAPKNRRLLNQQETVLLHLRTSSDLNDCSRTRPSTKVLSCGQRFQIFVLTRQSKMKLFRTSSDTNEQQRKRTKQIQKLSQVKVHLEKLFRKKHIRQSSNFSRHNAQSFRHLPIPNGRKMQETRTMSILPFSN